MNIQGERVISIVWLVMRWEAKLEISCSVKVYFLWDGHTKNTCSAAAIVTPKQKEKEVTINFFNEKIFLGLYPSVLQT